MWASLDTGTIHGTTVLTVYDSERFAEIVTPVGGEVLRVRVVEVLSPRRKAGR